MKTNTLVINKKIILENTLKEIDIIINLSSINIYIKYSSKKDRFLVN